MQRGQRGDAHIDLSITEAEPDPTVLGDASLGDVEVGHDLEATDDGRHEVHRGRRGVLQHAVDTVADPKDVGIGLDVDVRSASIQRLYQEQIHQLHDGRLVDETHPELARGTAWIVRGGAPVVEFAPASPRSTANNRAWSTALPTG